jgi:hypothetical protein
MESQSTEVLLCTMPKGGIAASAPNNIAGLVSLGIEFIQ